jgi:flagellar protein FliT
MLSAAEQGEWDHVSDLEQHCRSHVGALMRGTPGALSEKEQRAKVSIIRAILQNDARIRALAEPRLHELQQRLSTTRAGQRAVKAYGSHPM